MQNRQPTGEQQTVVDAPFGSRNLVLAGPGTGKTFTLVARIEKLMKEAPEDRPYSILTLSFTRAVVRELRDRMRRTEIRSHGAVRPVTFDSFATRLLYGVPSEAAWDGWDRGYDARIEHATRLLEESEEAREWLQRFDHLVVDEIQDLVHPRAELVAAVLDLVPSFDLYGDPAQGIYGWTLNGAEPDRTADRFREGTESTFSDLTIHELTENHRMSPSRAQWARRTREPLLTLRTAAGELDNLRAEVAEIEPLGSLSSASTLLRRLPGSVAILTRTNAEAMMVSDSLHDSDVPHELRRSSTDRAVAPWVAQVCRGLRSSLSQVEFHKRYSEKARSSDPDPELAWDLLASVGDDDEHVALSAVARSLRERRTPDELMATFDQQVVVFTIHRAKGLEFNNVLIVEPEGWRLERGDAAFEARVLYVGLTRARGSAFHLDTVDTGCWKLHQPTGRWYRDSWGKRWMTVGFEVRGADVHGMHPAGTFWIKDSPTELQSYIENEVQVGDEASLSLLGEQDGLPIYGIDHAGRAIGVSAHEFNRSLNRRLKDASRLDRVPLRIGPVRVEGIDTVAGLEGVGIDAGLGGSGLWLRPRVSGLGKLQWT